MLKVLGKAVVIAMAVNMTGFTYAVSSTASNKIKDFQLVHADGGEVRRSHVSIAVRRGYPGVVPKITKRASVMHPNCYDVKFIYKNEIRRLTFNCANGNRQLTMLTR
jgi:hypothetical protein